MLASSSGSFRASPRLMVAFGKWLFAAEKGECAITDSTELIKYGIGRKGGRSSTLCGRLCEWSIAHDAPRALAMISLENPHQRAHRIRSLLWSKIDSESARS